MFPWLYHVVYVFSMGTNGMLIKNNQSLISLLCFLLFSSLDADSIIRGIICKYRCLHSAVSSEYSVCSLTYSNLLKPNNYNDENEILSGYLFGFHSCILLATYYNVFKFLATTLPFEYLFMQACCIEYIILEGDNLSSLFPSAHLNLGGIELNSHTLFAVITTLAVLPTVWLRDLSILSYISGKSLFLVQVVISYPLKLGPICLWP